MRRFSVGMIVMPLFTAISSDICGGDTMRRYRADDALLKRSGRRAPGKRSRTNSPARNPATW